MKKSSNNQKSTQEECYKKPVTLLPQVTCLLKKGVRMTNPFSVEIGEEVNPERIAGSLVIYGAVRICGENTLIAEDVQLGYEAPVTLINCQLGSAVELKGGYFADSVFLDKAVMGSNAQVRSGCLLEEEASGNHTVGLKQTILFPFVTLGSLINFCDCFMAGGTSRKNHSEVGSSYIHFNYTPRQDKATASLIGDVPQGVMLHSAPIFLGGQGGLVGPVHIDYGTLIPAGSICRKDTPAEGLVWSQPQSARKQNCFLPGVSSAIGHKVCLNVLYIANLLALRQWYIHVRRDFFCKQKYGSGLYEGALNVLGCAVDERLKQMRLYISKMENLQIVETPKKDRRKSSSLAGVQKEILLKWPQVEKYLGSAPEEKIGLKKKEAFLKVIRNKMLKNNYYPDAIKSLKPAEAAMGTKWLQEIVAEITGYCFQKSSVQSKGK